MDLQDNAAEENDWIDMTAERYAQTMLQDIKRRVEDAHQSPADSPTRPKKRMSYST